MKSRKTFLIALAAVMLATLVGASQSKADPCSASASTLVSRSDGGTCASALSLNDELTMSYRIQNASIVDDPGGPNDGTGVVAKIPAGKTLTGTLAQETGGVGGTALPGTLAFVPVCTTGADIGDTCDPTNNLCAGGAACGCVSNLPGVTCAQNANPNKVTISIGADIAFSPGQSRTLATIKVKLTGVVPPPAVCGEFFTRVDSAGDVLITDDALCDNPVTAGAQASANLNAPECTTNAECGDAQCNQCVDVGTDNHCAPAAADTPCGSDSTPDDCLRPACVITNDVGVCTQQQIDAPEDTACTDEDGVPVPAVDCQAPSCDAAGACVNKPDAGQDGNACGTDEDPNDCKTATCDAGQCSQATTPITPGTACTSNDGVPVDTVECQAPECNVNGDCVNVADAGQNGDACGSDQNPDDCKTPVCDDGSCIGEANVPNGEICVDGLFCTDGDVCTAGICAGSLLDCSDGVECTEDTCDEDAKACVHTPNDLLCDDQDTCTIDVCSDTGCAHRADPSCAGDICRSPGFWATHSGYGGKNTINIGQLVIDQAGPFEVCGQTISTTSNLTSPYLEGLGLTSDLQGLCVAVQGTPQRQLYRQLIAATLNCAVSGDDCDAVTGKYIDVSYSDCNAVCAGLAAPLEPAPLPTANQCISRLNCFNNGGQIVEGKCAYGLCDGVAGEYCGGGWGDCALNENFVQPECVPFENNCHSAELCNEDVGICPEKTAASSSRACKEAKGDSCTIDSCE